MAKIPTTKEVKHDSPLGAAPTAEAPQLATNVQNANYGDDFEFYGDYKPADRVQETLPFRPGHEHLREAFNLKYFRADEHHLLNGTVKSGYWRTVKKDLAINGLCIAELFVDESDPSSPWDANGLIPYGRCIRTLDGRECREAYLAIRPAQASPAEDRIRARNSADAVKSRHKASGHEVAQAANAIAQQHYGQAPDSSPLVFSQLTSYDQEMRESLVTSGMWDGLKAGNKATP